MSRRNRNNELKQSQSPEAANTMTQSTDLTATVTPLNLQAPPPLESPERLAENVSSTAPQLEEQTASPLQQPKSVTIAVSVETYEGNVIDIGRLVGGNEKDLTSQLMHIATNGVAVSGARNSVYYPGHSIRKVIFHEV
jgi:hypothetical protein